MLDEASIRAIHGDQVSSTYSGSAVPSVDLVLESGFSLSGEVVPFADGASVFVEARTDHGDRTLGSLAVRPDGKFGPFVFQAPPAGEAWCRLVGGGLLAPLARFAVPDEGGSVFVTISAEEGHAALALVQSADGEPISGAGIQGLFESEPNRTEWFYSDDEGLVQVAGLPREGEFNLDTKAEGYETWIFGPYPLPREDPEPIVLSLRSAGDVEVVVRHGDEPVERFQLIYWDDSPYDLQWLDVQDAPGGRYLLEAVPEGLLHLYAYNEEFAQSDTATVHVSSTELAEASLDLPDPIVGTGRVIDGQTFLPLPEATVEPFTSVGGQFMTPWSDPQGVDSDGRFRVNGFSPKNARLIVNAPGYEEDYVSATPLPGQLLDFGALPLYAARSLSVRLIAEDAIDLSGYQVSVGGVRRFPAKAFSPEGIAEFRGCVAGYYSFTILSPSGASSSFYRYLYNGTPWEVDWELATGTHLVVELESSDGSALPKDTTVTAYHRGGSGPRSTRAKVSDGRTVFPSLLGDESVLEVRNAAGELLARKNQELAAPGPQTASLRLVASPVRVRVVDPASSPVSGASIHARCQDDTTGWATRARTDNEGIAGLQSPPCDPLHLSVFHPDYGHQYGILVNIPADENAVVDVEIDPAYSVRFRLKDGGKPVTGIKAFLTHVESRRDLPARYPDSDGRLMWTQLGPGSYVLKAGAPGYWFTEAVAVATRTSKQEHQVQFVRTGNLIVRAKKADGNPVPGLEIEVQSLGVSGDVPTWIAEGRVISSGQLALMTRGDGSLWLSGLPRGNYVVQAESSTGQTIRHEVEVPSGGDGEVELRVP